MVRHFSRLSVACSAAAILGVNPTPAAAQWHGPPPGHGHVAISVGVGFGYGYGWYPYFSPWYPYAVGIGWWYSPGYPVYPYYPYGYPIDNSGSVRIETRQRDADVYVDGYLAGKVDDCDGVFQRLRVSPGGHDLVVYRDGFHSYQQNLYLAPGSDQHLKFEMQPLAPGEAPDPRPVPQPRRGGGPSDDEAPMPRYGRGGGPPAGRPDQGPPPPPSVGPPPQGSPEPPQPAEPRVDPRSFGSLSLLVKPADAQILIDGNPWGVPSGESKIVVQLPEGRHHLEIQKEGYSRYAEDIGIMRGRTLSLNVSLVK